MVAIAATTASATRRPQRHQGRARHRHRRPRRQGVQPARQRGPEAGREEVRHPGRCPSRVEQRLRAEPDELRPQGLRPGDRGRLPEEQAVGQVAKKFPDTKFAIVDDSMTRQGHQGSHERPGPALQGAGGRLPRRLPRRAASRSEREGAELADVISTVGGIKIPPVDHYIAGFQAGAKAANPGIKLLNGYSNDFVDQAKCKGLAPQQIAQGSDIVFQVAGQCGLGALEAARDKGYWAIGVDTDQSTRRPAGPHVGQEGRGRLRSSTSSARS